MGPIDYLVVEWPGQQPNGELAPLLVDLVDRGLIRILDLIFMVKDADGSVEVLELGELPALAELAGVSTGLIDDEDLEEAASVLEPGASAGLLLYENSWAAPFAIAVRRTGGQMVASGRIPIQDILAALEAAEA
ncbi:MAG: DUF1269 domain-containing family protein [Solirubrobacterales bacterium 70-9]|nr:MAG: DUF1269 domain-containing family protein [Solirubrobacterales bacterium 70-9]